MIAVASILYVPVHGLHQVLLSTLLPEVVEVGLVQMELLGRHKPHCLIQYCIGAGAHLCLYADKKELRYHLTRGHLHQQRRNVHCHGSAERLH